MLGSPRVIANGVIAGQVCFRIPRKELRNGERNTERIGKKSTAKPTTAIGTTNWTAVRANANRRAEREPARAGPQRRVRSFDVFAKSARVVQLKSI